MTGAIVFISRNKIKGDNSIEFKKHYQDSIQPILDSKPCTLAQLAYGDEETAEFTVIRLFPDADALDQQIQGADERSKRTYEFIEPIAIEIYGTPNPATLEKMKKVAGSGIEVKIIPQVWGGFIRNLVAGE